MPRPRWLSWISGILGHVTFSATEGSKWISYFLILSQCELVMEINHSRLDFWSFEQGAITKDEKITLNSSMILPETPAFTISIPILLQSDLSSQRSGARICNLSKKLQVAQLRPKSSHSAKVHYCDKLYYLSAIRLQVISHHGTDNQKKLQAWCTFRFRLSECGFNSQNTLWAIWQ
jgi:hypothetical protein